MPKCLRHITAIELLVVISIIFILIALIAPVFQQLGPKERIKITVTEKQAEPQADLWHPDRKIPTGYVYYVWSDQEMFVCQKACYGLLQKGKTYSVSVTPSRVRMIVEVHK